MYWSGSLLPPHDTQSHLPPSSECHPPTLPSCTWRSLTLRLANLLPEDPSLKWEGPALSHCPWEIAQQICWRLNGNNWWIAKYFRNAGFHCYRSSLMNLGVPRALGIHSPEGLSSMCAECSPDRHGLHLLLIWTAKYWVSTCCLESGNSVASIDILVS